MARTRCTRAEAPGRVTILGEHTDYNEGRALGVATEERTIATCEPGRAGIVEVASSACGTATASIPHPEGPAFVVLAAALARVAGVNGARITVEGDLPLGAGLSSSASYAVAVALALGVEGTPLELARACQAAERAAGADVGLLDQLVILAASDGCVVDLDFAGPTVRSLTLHHAIGLSVVDTGERRLVADSAYAERRAECAAAAMELGRPLGAARREDLERLDDPVLLGRARHVVSECERVDGARRALRDGDLGSLGRLLDEGHASLRDDFESSTLAVEAVREKLASQRGVVGVRLTGAGFGGCLLVAHDPAVAVSVPSRWCSRLTGSRGAVVSSTR